MMNTFKEYNKCGVWFHLCYVCEATLRKCVPDLTTELRGACGDKTGQSAYASNGPYRHS